MIQVYTGNGKGKTTAALGLIIRALGSGKKVCLIQFMKKNNRLGEIRYLTRNKELDIFQFGTGKFIDPQNISSADREAAAEGIKKTFELISLKQYDLIILDEINIAVKWGLVKLADQLRLIEITGDTEIVMTGRYADERVMEKADLVTEMKEIKHYFSRGVKARKGIEF
ncbi:MAG: cob(I)yrinic acid a,c-diamide adenosyltransferase [Candidatus Cloacimonas sp. SDB]|nr:MAG: cob(I)yrinic acid a,c-diamide adenosyltransferase [Candidatus Cloacimonas sp. SDB]